MDNAHRRQMKIAHEIMVRRAPALKALADHETVAMAADEFMEADREILAKLARR